MTAALLAETSALIDAAWRAGLTPEPQLTVSQWADKHRILPQASAEPGKWRTSRVPYLREIMDCLSASSPVERVIFQKGAQIGGTEAGLNWVGYIIAHAPGTMLLVMPSMDMIKRNTRSRIDPLIEGTPALKERVVPARTREAGNTVALKEFIGGALVMTGANAPTGLRSTPARYIFCDEVDGFPADSNHEGDPVALAIKRTATFRGRRKIFLCSTPTLKGASRIETAYLESDQRRFFVPCRHCAAPFVIEWRHVRWPEGAPDRAYVACPGCGGVHDEAHKPAMVAAGRWQSTAPGDGRTAGFHLSALYSPFETWAEIAREFLAVKRDAPRLQAWTNTALGETWEDEASAPMIADHLAARAEDWGDALPVPVRAITAGADVQDDRLEVELVAWGVGEESWSLAYDILWGDPAKPEVWDQLDQVLARRFITATGTRLGVMAAAIDSGGHRTPEVMKFSQARAGRRVWPIKGRGGPGIPPWPKRPPKLTGGRLVTPFIIGVDGLKTALYARLRLTASGPGCCHFPLDRDLDWFQGLTAERPIRRLTKGVAKIEWIKDSGVRNEPLDCRVYATAALHGLMASGWRFDSEAPKTAPVVKSSWMAD